MEHMLGASFSQIGLKRLKTDLLLIRLDTLLRAKVRPGAK